MEEEKKILVVEADPDMLYSVKTILESDLGCSVIEAKDGEEAIKKYEEYKPKIVILELMLPKKSGFLVMNTIKTRGGALPYIIVVTGLQGKRNRQYAEHFGVKDYLNKPFSMEKLTGLVRGYLGISDANKSGESQKQILPSLEQILKASEEFVPLYAKEAFKQKISELYKNKSH